MKYNLEKAFFALVGLIGIAIWLFGFEPTLTVLFYLVIALIVMVLFSVLLRAVHDMRSGNL